MMPGKSTRAAPKEGPVTFQGRRVMAVTLKPGDRFPEGTYLQGWKLDSVSYGENKLYLIYEPEEKT